jgi:hypothetical protein
LFEPGTDCHDELGKWPIFGDSVEKLVVSADVMFGLQV